MEFIWNNNIRIYYVISKITIAYIIIYINRNKWVLNTYKNSFWRMMDRTKKNLVADLKEWKNRQNSLALFIKIYLKLCKIIKLYKNKVG